MKRSKTSLKWKLLTFILLFAGLIILVFYIFQILLLDKIYKSTKLAQTKELMNEVYEVISSNDINSLENPNSDVYAYLSDLMTENESYIYLIKQEPVILDIGFGANIVDVEYKIKFPGNMTSLDFSQRLFDKKMLSFVYNNIESIGSPYFVISNTDFREEFKMIITNDDSAIDDDILYCQRVKIGNDARNYMIVLYTRVTPVQPAIDTLKTQFIFIVIIVVLLTLLFVFTISRSISRPIIDINTAAKSLPKGEYKTTVKKFTFKEIAELNETLNSALIELNKTENLQRELLANVSHDLRTPLTLISGYAEMIRDLPGEDNSENIQVIIDEANRLKMLVSDLLVLSRISAKTEVFNVSKINLTEVVKSMVDRHQKFVQSQNFVIDFIYDDEVEIEADVNKIEQVVYNFISNAINYSGESRKIEVIQVVEDGFVTIKIKDYGIGIKPEDIDFVWERYYRVDKALQRSTQGSGLGLSIIKGILDYHGFKYGVESTIGEGSTFYFKAPIVKKS